MRSAEAKSFQTNSAGRFFVRLLSKPRPGPTTLTKRSKHMPFLHLRISDKEYWRGERDPAICGAIGTTYETPFRPNSCYSTAPGASHLLH